MNVLKAIRYKLVNDAPVAAIVGAKVYWGVAPQGATVPFVVLNVVGNVPNDTKSGVSDVDAFAIQIDSYTATYEQLQDLDRKVRTAIDKQTGTWDGIVVDGIRYLTSRDDFENEPQERRRSSDYTVRIKY